MIKIKNLFILGMILLLVLALTGCDEDTSADDSGTRAFLGGDTGLTAEFGQKAPPDEVYDNDKYPFDITIELENVGEHDLESDNGYVEIIGIKPEHFGKSGQDDFKTNFEDDMNGARRKSDGTRLKGDKTFVEFEDLSYKLDSSGDIDFNIRADICYDYKTIATSKICIKENMIDDLETKKTCIVNEGKSIQNSGAPLQITKLVQDASGKEKIQLTFTIDHVGNFEESFFKKSTECDTSINNDDLYKVYFKIVKPEDSNIECSALRDSESGSSSEGYITLHEKDSRDIICRLDTSDVTSTYEEPIEVELEYRYLSYLEKEVKVKDILD